MRDFILEQINASAMEKGQLDEIDLSSALGNLKNVLTSKNSRINKEFAELVSSKFEGDFGKFLKKHLIKKGKKMDTVKMLVNYFKNDSDENYDDVFALIGSPMLDYFVKKTFGKTSIRGRIKQMTPFLKKVSTGDKNLDTFVYLAMSDALGEREVEDDFKGAIKSTIDDKLIDALDDQDFWDFLKDLMDEKEEEEEVDDDDIDSDEELEEAFGINKMVKNAKRGVRNAFSDTSDKYRWKIVDMVADVIPSLKKSILRSFKNEVWEFKYKDVLSILKGGNTNRLSEALTKSILTHIVKESRGLYFKEDYLAEMTEFVEEVFKSSTIVLEMKNSIRNYFREQDLVRKKLERDKKNKRNSKRKNGKKGNISKISDFLTRKGKEPIYKDVAKY